MIVRELISRLGFAVDRGSIAKVDGTIKQVDAKASHLAASIRGMFGALVAVETVKRVISMGDAMQSLEARIKLLPQTVGSAAASFDDVAKRASAARTSIEAYGNLYVRLAQSLRQYGFAQGDVLEVTDAISQALVVSGAQATEAASVTLQLSQAFNKGKLDGDEFRAFMEGLSADFKDKLSAEIGTTSDKLFELSRTGELTAKKLAEAFRNMAPEIRRQMLEMPMTVGQAVQIAGNRISEFVVKLNRESSFISKIAKSIVTAMDWIDAKTDDLGKRFRGWGNIIRYFGVVAGIVFAGKLIPLIATVVTSFNWMWLAIAAGALILDDIITWFRGGESAIGDLLGNTDEARRAFVTFFSIIGGGIALFKAYQGAVVAAKAVQVAWGGVMTAITGIQWLLNVAMAANPIGLIIAGVVALIAAGVLLVRNWEVVRDFFVGFFAMVGDKIMGLIGWVGKLFGMMGKVGGEINVNANAVGASGMAGVGKSTTNQQLNKNTTVHVTVPPGTTAEQAAYLNKAAKAAFAQDGGVSATDMAVFAP